MQAERFDYKLPQGLIAQKPISPRDSAKLLVYSRKTGKVAHAKFSDLPKHLPHGAVLVMNETRVLPARLSLIRATGGRVRALFLEEGRYGFKFLADRHLKIGEVLRGPRQISFTVISKSVREYIFEPSFAVNKIYSVLERYGAAPVPPYIKDSPLSTRELRAQYQTLFAKNTGSVAAPTASLHFTKRLLRSLKSSGIELRFITLHVGLGTFAPLSAKSFRQNRLHRERYEISRGTSVALERAKRDGRPIIAVGTTVVRALESAARRGRLAKLSGETTLFIHEPYKFGFIDGLVTNFQIGRAHV